MTWRELRAWRERMGWTQKRAAARLGVKVRAIQYWEAPGETARGPTSVIMLRLACERLEQQYRGALPMRIKLKGKRRDETSV